jgi:hypothetical protein
VLRDQHRGVECNRRRLRQHRSALGHRRGPAVRRRAYRRRLRKHGGGRRRGVGWGG